MSRDNILHKVRTALGRSAGQAVADLPPVRLRIPETPMEERIAVMRERIETLAGVTARVPDMQAAREYVREAIAGKTALASNAPYLAECGISTLPGVRCGILDAAEMREVSARVDVGITSADYALGDTGTLVMLASPAEARLVSLLPPAHLAVVPVERILTGLDELFTLLPNPGGADQFDGVDHRAEPHRGYRTDPGARRSWTGTDHSGDCRLNEQSMWRDADTAIGGNRDRFPSTQLSLIEAAAGEPLALEQVAALYWKPVYKFIRHKFGKSNEEAKDLTQGFFASALERDFFQRFDPAKAGFRTYLRLAVERFASTRHQAETRQKRGGGRRGDAARGAGGCRRVPRADLLRGVAPPVVRALARRAARRVRSLRQAHRMGRLRSLRPHRGRASVVCGAGRRPRRQAHGRHQLPGVGAAPAACAGDCALARCDRRSPGTARGVAPPVELSDRVVHHLREVVDLPDLGGTRYELREELGRGGLGVVYAAFDTQLERRVALKVMDAEWAGEARLIARLEHPGIVPVYETGLLADGRAFYAMKLVDGTRADRFIAATPPLGERLRVLERVGEALAYAHSCGVLHRDLKPQNIMVGRFGEVYVMDWAVDGVAGTPAFRAPEAALDERSDVFAFGALLAFMLPGGAPPALRAVAAKAMSAQPEERYPAVPAVLREIERYQDGLRVEAYAETPWQRARRFARRNEVLLWLLAAYAAVKFLLFFAHTL